jgi:hypothetical protein
VQLYQQPDGTKVELPSDYTHAWSNGNGDYILANSGDYNPNGSEAGNWQELTPAAH